MKRIMKREVFQKIDVYLLKAVLHACGDGGRQPCVMSTIFGGHVADFRCEMEKRSCA